MAFLLDVNVLIALMWPAHEAHQRVHAWFQRYAKQGWATCPLTQAGFVRIVSNRAFSPNAVTAQEAVTLLDSNLKHSSHQFWPDDTGFAEVVAPFLGRLFGHRQVTDAYLLGLAIRSKGKLATLDRTVSSLLPDGSPEREYVVVI